MSPAQRDSHLRETVLRAAVDIVEKEGVGALSMREVARRAGVSHQAPYHYFADKSEILASIAEEGFHLLAETFDAVLANNDNPLEASFIAYVTMAIENPGHFRIMFRPELCAVEDHENSRVAADRAFGSLLALVERVAPVDITPDEALVWAIGLWSQAHGLATLIIDGPLLRKLPDQPTDELVGRVARLLATHFAGRQTTA